jgi:aminopeptidase N
MPQAINALPNAATFRCTPSAALFVLVLLLLGSLANAQPRSNSARPTRQDTLNGSVTPERSWWDVQRYDLTIKPDYRSKTLTGKNIIHYRVTQKRPLYRMQIDLAQSLRIDSAFQHRQKVACTRTGDVWYLTIPKRAVARTNDLTIYYSGTPKESVAPPWDGGVVWTTDSLGRPWMSVACQYPGARVWYPCKNTMQDKCDQGAGITLIVPDTLVAVGNGRLLRKEQAADHTVAYHWGVTNPISHYGLTFYIGKYINISGVYPGEQGALTTDYWVLDYHRAPTVRHMVPEVTNTLHSLEHWFGPYPFYADGFKMVEAPYIGMEHQSAIAYGNNFTKGTYKGRDISNTGWGRKTDRVIVHEVAHEWFGNNLTAIDLADRWVQEGFAGLAEELVLADLCGPQAGTEFLAGRYRSIENDGPIIGRYGINENGSDDNYIKGWAILHMIKTTLADDATFRQLLHKLNRHFRHSTVTTAQVEHYISRQAGTDFSRLFDQYLRTASIPVLEYKMTGNDCFYRFTNCNSGFTMGVKMRGPQARWFYPTTQWQSMKLDSTFLPGTLPISPDFYITVKKGD